MKYYKEVIFTEPDPARRELLVAKLSLLGYDGFEEDGDSLKAYISLDAFEPQEVDRLAEKEHQEFRVNTLQERNWNAEWESSFSPVVVDGQVAIRAHFHEPVPGIPLEIVVTPKMSFGTGHHATTWLMIRAMLDLDMRDRKVLDLGTGTGVLAILAEKLGAASVLALDNDPWSVENAGENLGLNGCRSIRVEQSDRIPGGATFDVILANINKHILLEHCREICRAVNPGGRLLLSGILKEDLNEIGAAYSTLLGRQARADGRDGWLVLAF